MMLFEDCEFQDRGGDDPRRAQELTQESGGGEGAEDVRVYVHVCVCGYVCN